MCLHFPLHNICFARRQKSVTTNMNKQLAAEGIVAAPRLSFMCVVQLASKLLPFSIHSPNVWVLRNIY